MYRAQYWNKSPTVLSFVNTNPYTAEIHTEKLITAVFTLAGNPSQGYASRRYTEKKRENKIPIFLRRNLVKVAATTLLSLAASTTGA